MIIAYPEVVDYSEELVSKNIEQDINILYNAIASSSTQKDYSTVYLDIFTDNTGYDNTIDNINSTAFFYNGTYSSLDVVYYDVAEYSENISVYQLNATFSNINELIKEIKCMAKVQSSPRYIKYNFVYDDATNQEVEELISELTYAEHTIINPNQEKIVEHIELYIKGGGAGHSNYSKENKVIGFDLIKIVKTNNITLDETPAFHQLYCHSELNGTSNITYNISFDNGATWGEDYELNTKNAIGTTNTGNMIIKINLNGQSSDNTANISDYGLMIYKEQ